MAEVTILNYGIGNTGSIANMLRKLRISANIVTTPAAIAGARRVILPGIGAFDACMQALKQSDLLAAVLDFASAGRPLLGICVGMQMLTNGSEEGALPGLGLIPARTRRFAMSPGMRIPHMGWNAVTWNGLQHPLAQGLEENRFYFVHSYYVDCDSEADVLGTCQFGAPFAAAIARGSVAGVQFHPEKSHRFGLQLLSNFAAL
ncbi:MAG: imidazole glycerol phosphate synthase subunit HisH [Alphaproteobacteria bacterium]|nr:imidazole glycerol phosphate synthase subunit HisH [Alphaproteobacteria bacterium]